MATEHFFTKALWSETAGAQTFPSLQEDITVDVAIIGGGITGICTACNLARAGMKIAVLEANQVGMGTTGSSTGNLYVSINEHLHKIKANFDEGTMKAVAASRNAGIDFIEQCINEYGIDCQFQRVPWYLFATKDDRNAVKQVEKELAAAKASGLPAGDKAPESFPYRISSLTQVNDQAQFNPLAYVQQLAAAVGRENCRIYEHTKVLKIEDGDPCLVHTTRGKVRAKKVVQASHSPKGVYAVHAAMEVYREYAFAVRLKGPLPDPGIYWHLTEKQLYSIRPVHTPKGNYLIVLDASQKVGHKKHTEDSFKSVEAYMRAHFDVDHIAFSWAAQNYKSADSLPYIGRSPMENNIYIATGFGPDGLTYGALSANLITDLILERQNPWAKMYSPTRFTPAASAKRFVKETVDVAAHLVKDYLFTGDEEALRGIKSGEGKVIKLDDKKVAAFRDTQGQLHIVSAVCTHMGCIVHWNNGEKSWDCPCHGSRFSIAGKVLEGPAIQDLKKVNIQK